MKKKVLAAILALVSAGCLGVGLTACGGSGTSDTGDKWGSVYTVEAAYAEASTLGYSGTLEEFISSISGKDGANGTNGKDGVGISKIEIISDNLKVTLTDGSVLELGSIKGDKGDTGAQGEKGDKGDTGATGAQGEKGDKGDDGESAYQIWLNNGHTGTQADFLEWLKGAQGEKGDKGDDGESAYQIWLKNGHTGSQADFLEWLKGGDENPLGLDFYVLDDGTYGVAVGKAKYLSNVEIPSTYNGKTVSIVLENAFISSNVKSVVIPDSVTVIGNNAFSSCAALESVYYTGTEQEWNTITIGSNENLTEETIYFYSKTEPTTSGNFWHYDTDGKTVLKWQTTEKEEVIEYVAGTPGLEYRLGGDVYSCVGIGTATETDITIANYYDGKPVTAVYTRAFQDCTSITSVTIPDGIVTINSRAFYGCTSLESVSLGNTIKTVGNGAFGNCNLLNYNEYDNAYYLGNSANPYQALINAKDTNISSCEINSATKAIGYRAFAYCNSLTSVDVPDKVISINTEAFVGCSALESVTIPEGVLVISSYAFKDCTALKNITIPNSIQTFANGVFEGCTSLNYTEYDNALYFGNATNAYIVLIKAKSQNITSCQINSNTKFICDYAFKNCTLLTQIEIPVGVVGIETYAFSGCTSLESIAFPEGFKRLDTYAFKNCTSLSVVTIPDSITTIRSNAFEGTALETVYYKGTAEEWAKVSVGSTVPFGNATLYYYSATEPTSSGNFWHYAADGKTVVIW